MLHIVVLHIEESTTPLVALDDLVTAEKLRQDANELAAKAWPNRASPVPDAIMAEVRQQLIAMFPTMEEDDLNAGLKYGASFAIMPCEYRKG